MTVKFLLRYLSKKGNSTKGKVVNTLIPLPFSFYPHPLLLTKPSISLGTFSIGTVIQIITFSSKIQSKTRSLRITISEPSTIETWVRYCGRGPKTKTPTPHSVDIRYLRGVHSVNKWAPVIGEGTTCTCDK